MQVQHFFDSNTSTLTYVVFDKNTRDAVIIDPVLNFDQASGTISDEGLQDVVAFVSQAKLKPHFILETHAHADHLSSSQLLKQVFPGTKIAIGHRIKSVQEVFKDIFNLEKFNPDGAQFDFLIEDGKEFKAGAISIYPIPTPGHTPACMSFLIGDDLFSGDSLFMPDYGTGRCDFPKGSAKDLYNSVMRLYELPESTKVFVGHDYQPNGRELKFETTIGESKKNNIQLKSTTTQEEYVLFREARDKTLEAPKLLLPSLQVNIEAGHLPLREANGVSYLKLPLKLNLTKGNL